MVAHLIVVLAATLPVGLIGPRSRWRDRVDAVTASWASIFEWFGELGLFCKRVAGAVFNGSS
jgi:hypothetical protein